MRAFLLYIQIVFSMSTMAQSIVIDPEHPDKVNMDLRSYATKTCFEAGRLEAMINAEENRQEHAYKEELSRKGEDTAQIFWLRAGIILPDSIFQQLTPLECFVYAHEHPTSFVQNCGSYAYGLDYDANVHANLPFFEAGQRMGERQEQSLLAYRDSSLYYLSQCMGQQHCIPLAYKHTLVLLNGVELMPLLLRKAARQEALKGDTQLYTVLLLLMKQNNYPDFLESEVFSKLYGVGVRWRATIPRTTENEQQIRDLATRFYQWYQSTK